MVQFVCHSSSYVYNRGQILRKSMIIVTDRNVSVMGHCGVRLEIEVNWSIQVCHSSNSHQTLLVYESVADFLAKGSSFLVRQIRITDNDRFVKKTEKEEKVRSCGRKYNIIIWEICYVQWSTKSFYNNSKYCNK